MPTKRQLELLLTNDCGRNTKPKNGGINITDLPVDVLGAVSALLSRNNLAHFGQSCKRLVPVTAPWLRLSAQAVVWSVSTFRTCPNPLWVTNLQINGHADEIRVAVGACPNVTFVIMDQTDNKKLNIVVHALARLRHLVARRCLELRDLNVLRGRGSLEILSMGGCVNLKDISALVNCPGLKKLGLSDCHRLRTLPPFKGLLSISISDA